MNKLNGIPDSVVMDDPTRVPSYHHSLLGIGYCISGLPRFEWRGRDKGCEACVSTLPLPIEARKLAVKIARTLRAKYPSATSLTTPGTDKIDRTLRADISTLIDVALNCFDPKENPCPHVRQWMTKALQDGTPIYLWLMGDWRMIGGNNHPFRAVDPRVRLAA